MERPNIKDYGLTVYFPFTKQRRRYNTEYEDYNLSKLEKSEQKIYKIRKNQMANINGLSWLLIALVTTFWGLYYNISFEQNHMGFLSLGLHQHDPSWIERGTLFIVPAGSGTVIHNLPKALPGKKLRIISHVIIKIIPIIILIIFYYLIKTEKLIWKIKKETKKDEFVHDSTMLEKMA